MASETSGEIGPGRSDYLEDVAHVAALLDGGDAVFVNFAARGTRHEMVITPISSVTLCGVPTISDLDGIVSRTWHAVAAIGRGSAWVDFAQPLRSDDLADLHPNVVDRGEIREFLELVSVQMLGEKLQREARIERVEPERIEAGAERAAAQISRATPMHGTSLKEMREHGGPRRPL